MKFILAPIVFILGFLLMKYSVKVTEFTGTVGFAEKYLKGGPLAGTYTWYKIVGLVFCVLSALWITGLFNFSFLSSIITGVGN